MHRWEVSQGLLDLAIEPQCLIEGCGKAKGNGCAGLCKMHYDRKRRGLDNWADPRPWRNHQGPVPPDVAAAFAADYAIAKRVNGKTPTGSPAHEVNRRFNATLWALKQAGHTHAQIAEAAGATVHMVDMRLKKIRASRSATKSRPDVSPPIPEEMHGTATGYRYYKCRCAECRRHHAEEHRERRWALRYGPGAPMGPEVRERILDMLRRSGSLDDVVAEVQVKHQTIYSAARAVPEFGALVRELTSGDLTS
jgi:hypothetical protein